MSSPPKKPKPIPIKFRGKPYVPLPRDPNDPQQIRDFLVDGIEETSPGPTDRKELRKLGIPPQVKLTGWGGWRGKEESLSMLLAYSGKFLFGTENAARKCHCGQPALRQLDRCRHHAKITWRRRRRAAGKAIATIRQFKSRKAGALVRTGRLPMDLVRNEIFQKVSELSDFDLNPDPRSRMAARLIQYEMIRAWTFLMEGEYAPWADVLQKARTLGIGV